MTEASGERKPVRARGRKDRREIDENLRRVYEDMVDDSVPERFLELLEKLREEGRDR